MTSLFQVSFTDRDNIPQAVKAEATSAAALRLWLKVNKPDAHINGISEKVEDKPGMPCVFAVCPQIERLYRLKAGYVLIVFDGGDIIHPFFCVVKRFFITF